MPAEFWPGVTVWSSSVMERGMGSRWVRLVREVCDSGRLRALGAGELVGELMFEGAWRIGGVRLKGRRAAVTLEIPIAGEMWQVFG